MRREILPGTDIHEAIRDLVNDATKLGHTIKAKFNGAEITVAPHADPAVLLRAWELRQCELERRRETRAREEAERPLALLREIREVGSVPHSWSIGRWLRWTSEVDEALGRTEQ